MSTTASRTPARDALFAYLYESELIQALGYDFHQTATAMVGILHFIATDPERMGHFAYAIAAEMERDLPCGRTTYQPEIDRLMELWEAAR
jgi:hypothetical protein